MSEEEINEVDVLAMKDRAGYKNLVAAIDYTRKTRDMFRELQKENELYKNQILEQSKVIGLLKEQMVKLQIKVYQNNSTV